MKPPWTAAGSVDRSAVFATMAGPPSWRSDIMTEAEAQRQKEIQQAEELLFGGPQALGFAKGLFQGHFVSDGVMPYARIAEGEQGALNQIVTELRKFLNADLDPAEIDRQADIPRSV